MVKTDEVDGDEFGNEWTVHYIVYETEDDNGFPVFDLYEGDDKGNSVKVATFGKLKDARSIVLKLGEEVR